MKYAGLRIPCVLVRSLWNHASQRKISISISAGNAPAEIAVATASCALSRGHWMRATKISARRAVSPSANKPAAELSTGKAEEESVLTLRPVFPASRPDFPASRAVVVVVVLINIGP